MKAKSCKSRTEQTRAFGHSVLAIAPNGLDLERDPLYLADIQLGLARAMFIRDWPCVSLFVGAEEWRG